MIKAHTTQLNNAKMYKTKFVVNSKSLICINVVIIEENHEKHIY